MGSVVLAYSLVPAYPLTQATSSTLKLPPKLLFWRCLPAREKKRCWLHLSKVEKIFVLRTARSGLNTIEQLGQLICINRLVVHME